MKPVVHSDPDKQNVYVMLQQRAQAFAEAMLRWPTVCYLPIELHIRLQKGSRDGHGVANALIYRLELFEGEGRNADFYLDLVIWDGPLQFGIEIPPRMHCPSAAREYFLVDPFKRK